MEWKLHQLCKQYNKSDKQNKVEFLATAEV